MENLTFLKRLQVKINNYLCRNLGCVQSYKTHAPLHKGWNETEHRCSRCGHEYSNKYYVGEI